MSKLKYQPLQPHTSFADPWVHYQEMPPDPGLSQCIYCYWQLRSLRPLPKSFQYRVVADGCFDVFFPLDQPEDSWVMGFCNKYTRFELDRTFNYVGIRFLPAVFPGLFRVKGIELLNKAEPLAMVAPEFAAYIRNRIDYDPTPEELTRFFDHYFLNLANKSGFDPRLQRALNLILENTASLRVEKDLEVGLSSRQLRRLFDFYVGTNVKSFTKVVRFQQFIRNQAPGNKAHQYQHHYEAGFFDQAHLIREFKQYYGLTPGQALKGRG